MILTLPPYDDDSTWTVVDAVFRLPKEQRPTAVACMNDYLAVSLSERLKVLGLSVPADVAITGFDNIVPALPNGSGLTTVAQPYEEIGTAAVDLLMRRIKDPRAASRSFQLPAQLIVRESSTLQME
jgi:LacI family transcriptional regulator